MLTAIQYPQMIVYQHENIDYEDSENPIKHVLTAEELHNRQKISKYHKNR